jgi:hypothetical protein
MFLCPICNRGAGELRWNIFTKSSEVHCRQCDYGTTVLSDDYLEIH